MPEEHRRERRGRFRLLSSQDRVHAIQALDRQIADETNPLRAVLLDELVQDYTFVEFEWPEDLHRELERATSA